MPYVRSTDQLLFILCRSNLIRTKRARGRSLLQRGDFHQRLPEKSTKLDDTFLRFVCPVQLQLKCVACIFGL